VIKLNFAADPEDLRRLVEGVRLAWQVAHQPEIARHTDHVALLTEETMSSDDALATYVRATVATQFHPCGTARMGPADDAMAVIDQRCRLRAVPNLRVVDASVMPTIPRANIKPHLHHDRRARVRLDAKRGIARAPHGPIRRAHLHHAARAADRSSITQHDTPSNASPDRAPALARRGRRRRRSST
jgi:hypothetical protein